MKDRIVTLLSVGKTYDEIVKEVGCSKATISYHAKKLGLGKNLSRYDWRAIRTFYDAGHSLEEAMATFGFSRGAWDGAIKRGDIQPRSTRIPLKELLVEGRTQTGRSHLKGRLLSEGLLEWRCYECGLTEWRGREIALHLDHKNGRKHDNRLENLWLLCPNCHDQQPTSNGKKWDR